MKGYRWLWALLALWLAACAATSAPADKPVIRLAVNPWESSQLNVEIAKIILTEELGYPVEVVTADEYAQWDSLERGELHACLEVWPSGHLENVRRYIETEQTVVDGGPLGPVGKMGWYIPSYMVRRQPELATWQGFQKPELARLFATVETGNRGAFLAGDPGWVQYDADIIRNLNLPLEVVVLGSEAALLDALAQAYQAEKPILLYFWTPHWAHVLYDLVPVQLPPYSEACYARAEAGGVDCDYPQDELYKIFWAGFGEYAPEAQQFLRNFRYTNRDQISLMAMVQINGLTPEAAARTWVRDNEATWRAWLP